MRAIEAFYVAFGHTLRRVRSARGLTQAEVGARLSPPVTRASIANLESGKQRVLVHTVVQLAAILEVGVEELVRGAPLPATGPAIVAELRTKLGLGAAAAARLARRLGLRDGTPA